MILALLLTLSPCQYEDSSNCYWNASVSGNKIGQSFVNIELVPGTAWAFYLPKRFR